MKNVTPHGYRCQYGQCPAVYDLLDGRALIIGKRADDFAADSNTPVGHDEAAVIVDVAMLRELLQPSAAGQQGGADARSGEAHEAPPPA